jgi:hypothetical protein
MAGCDDCSGRRFHRLGCRKLNRILTAVTGVFAVATLASLVWNMGGNRSNANVWYYAALTAFFALARVASHRTSSPPSSPDEY